MAADERVLIEAVIGLADPDDYNANLLDLEDSLLKFGGGAVISGGVSTPQGALVIRYPASEYLLGVPLSKAQTDVSLDNNQDSIVYADTDPDAVGRVIYRALEAAATAPERGAVLEAFTTSGGAITLQESNPPGRVDHVPHSELLNNVRKLCAINAAGSGDLTLTADQGKCGTLSLTGLLTGARSVIVPTTRGRFWIISNATTGAFDLTVKTAAGTGVIVAQGYTSLVRCDGTNIVRVSPNTDATGSAPPTGAAGGVLSGTYPNPGFAADMATQAELDAHVNDAADAHDASAISSVAAGGLAATDVQAALNELDTEKATAADLAAHLADAADAHDASAISSVAAGGLAATDVQAALNELDTEKAATALAVMDGDAAGGVLAGTYPNPSFASDLATQAELDAHISDAADAHAASAITNTPAGGIAAVTVQAALNELDSEKATAASLDAHLADAADAHAASAITNTPAGSIAATTVQAAIDELESEKAAAASAVLDGDAAGGVLAGTYPNPSFASDLATQAELDAHAGAGDPHAAAGYIKADGSRAFTGSYSMGNFSITNLAAPPSATSAARKSYVDDGLAATGFKLARAATTAALPAHTRATNTLTASANGALAAQDGISLAVGERLLVKNEGASHLEHGLYSVTDLGSAGTPWILDRVTDADAAADLPTGTVVVVSEGTVGADTGWILTTNAPIVLNTTALTFAQVLPAVLRTGDTMTGALLIDGSVVGAIQLLVQMAAGQTANAFVVEKSDGTDVFVITPSGQVGFGSGVVPATDFHFYDGAGQANMRLESGNADAVFVMQSVRNADADTITQLNFNGYDDAGTPAVVNYGQVKGLIVDSAVGAGKGKLTLSTRRAGALAEMVVLTDVFAGIRQATPANILDLGGALGWPITASTAGDLTLDETHGTARFNATAAVRTANLPAAAGCARRIYVVKKMDSSANGVIVEPNGAETIDGATNKTLGSQYATIMIQSNGTNWDTLSQFGTIT